MDQEIRAIEQLLEDPKTVSILGRDFTTGSINGVEVVTAITGYGKVAVAAIAALALQAFDAAAVVFAGVAGSINPEVKIGDVVVADRLVQHDLDASPIFETYVVPSLGVAEIETDLELTAGIATAARRFLDERAKHEVGEIPEGLFDPDTMTIHIGLIASGDRFINNIAEAASLQGEFPDVLAVEMEGAALAQVCAERHIPFAVFRLISDNSDQDAEVDFISFISSVAAPLTAGVIDEWTAAAR